MADPVTAGLMIGGTVMSAYGQMQEGDAAYEAGKRKQAYSRYQSAQLRQNAKQEVASSQRTAIEQTRQSDLVASRALAVAAASGGGASDPGVMRIISGIEGEGAYRRSVALYEGAEAARALEDQATATEYGGDIALEGGKQARTASRIGAVSTVLKGGSSMYDKFGPGAV